MNVQAKCREVRACFDGCDDSYLGLEKRKNTIDSVSTYDNEGDVQFCAKEQMLWGTDNKLRFLRPVTILAFCRQLYESTCDRAWVPWNCGVGRRHTWRGYYSTGTIDELSVESRWTDRIEKSS